MSTPNASLGNKFGEPVVAGFNRSFGMIIADERYEFIKPIMFTAGVGVLDDRHKAKGEPVEGVFLCAIRRNLQLPRNGCVQGRRPSLPHRYGRWCRIEQSFRGR